jgi:hypothetical protein
MQTHQKESKILRPDSRGRIALGKMAEGVSGFKAIYDEKTHRIILEPYAEVRVDEKWIFENPEIFEKVKRGMKQAKQGRLVDRGSFSQFLDEEEED